MDNREILNKADFALADLTSGGGKLSPAQSIAFMRLAIDAAKVMPMSTVVPMKAHTQEINQMKFSGRIVRAAAEATALAEADRSKPTTSKVTLTAKKFKAECRMSTETLEDSIEAGSLKSTIMSLMAEQVALDIDSIVTNSSVGNADATLAYFDGLLAAATSNVVAHNAVTNRALFKKLLRAMPSRYSGDLKSLRFLTSYKSEIDYRDSLGDRATVAGDHFVLDNAPAMFSGVPVVGIPVFPQTQGGGSDTTCLLLNPKNINIGIYRDITVETEKLIREDVFVAVLSFRMDFKYAEEQAVVKGTGVSVA